MNNSVIPLGRKQDDRSSRIMNLDWRKKETEPVKDFRQEHKVLFWTLIRRGGNTGQECVCVRLHTHVHMCTHITCTCMHVPVDMDVCISGCLYAFISACLGLPESLGHLWLIAQACASWYNEETEAVKQQTSGELSANKFHLTTLSLLPQYTPKPWTRPASLELIILLFSTL